MTPAIHRNAFFQAFTAVMIAFTLGACSKEEGEGCGDHDDAPEAEVDESGSKSAWTQTLITPALGYNYTNDVYHPAGVEPAGALNEVRVRYDATEGRYVYTMEYVVNSSAPAGTDTWTLPITFTNEHEHLVITEALVTDGVDAIYKDRAKQK